MSNNRSHILCILSDDENDDDSILFCSPVFVPKKINKMDTTVPNISSDTTNSIKLPSIAAVSVNPPVNDAPIEVERVHSARLTARLKSEQIFDVTPKKESKDNVIPVAVTMSKNKQVPLIKREEGYNIEDYPIPSVSCSTTLSPDHINSRNPERPNATIPICHASNDETSPPELVASSVKTENDETMESNDDQIRALLRIFQSKDTKTGSEKCNNRTWGYNKSYHATKARSDSIDSHDSGLRDSLDKVSTKHENDDKTETDNLSLHSRPHRNKCTKRKSGRNDKFCYSDDDSDDDESCISNIFKKRNKSQSKNCHKKRTVDTTRLEVKKLPKLSMKEEEEILSNIENIADRELQALLWDIGFRFTLFPHQFDGIRSVAGVPSTFPRNDTMKASKFYSIDSNSLHNNIVPKTRGLLLADDMGLGKTVQSIGGIMLRNHFGFPKVNNLPTIICAPNLEILQQWKDTLILTGVKPSKIIYFVPQKTTQIAKSSFVLMTHYNIATELKNVMESLDSRGCRSPLFANISNNAMHVFRNQYRASNGKEKNEFSEKGETCSDVITRFISRQRQIAPLFKSLIIDEAHFLRNLTTYWGIGGALMALHAERTVALTGTPYNNGAQDLATLMTFIDPKHPSSYRIFWEKATAGGTVARIVESAREWRTNYMLRRDKDILLQQLPPKHIIINSIPVSSAELSFYCHQERKLITYLEKFRSLETNRMHNPETILKMKRIFTIMMAVMSSMRMALVHPVVPSGREITKLFSPSRKNMVRCEERPTMCVVCQSKKYKQTAPESPSKIKVATANGDKVATMDLDSPNIQDKDPDVLEDDDSDEDLGDLIPFDSAYCRSTDQCQHFVHEVCLESVMTCPRCCDLEQRLMISETCQSGLAPIYCQNVQVLDGSVCGFRASAKLQHIVEWVTKKVPITDKVVILSFFKGSLDLLEGILTYDFSMECARFDGDVNPEERNFQLERFKTDPDCRVLLASVQTGGTGLNIVEANHVCFVDRWFNPQVHRQAEDRCFRIKQTKPVFVHYNDVAVTIDQVMATLNEIKSTNAQVVLADGSSLGASSDNLTYKELSGSISLSIRYLAAARATYETNQSELMKPIQDDVLKDLIALSATLKSTMQETDYIKASIESIQKLEADKLLSQDTKMMPIDTTTDHDSTADHEHTADREHTADHEHTTDHEHTIDHEHTTDHEHTANHTPDK